MPVVPGGDLKPESPVEETRAERPAEERQVEPSGSAKRTLSPSGHTSGENEALRPQSKAKSHGEPKDPRLKPTEGVWKREAPESEEELLKRPRANADSASTPTGETGSQVEQKSGTKATEDQDSGEHVDDDVKLLENIAIPEDDDDELLTVNMSDSKSELVEAVERQIRKAHIQHSMDVDDASLEEMAVCLCNLSACDVPELLAESNQSSANVRCTLMDYVQGFASI